VEKSSNDELHQGGLLDALMNGAMDAIIVFDASAHVVTVNAAARKLLTLNSKNQAPEIFDAFSASSVEDLRSELSDYVAGGNRRLLTATPREMQMRGAKGPIAVEATIREFRERGRAMFVFVARDITQRKETEEKRRSLERELLQANKLEAVGQLAGGIAHEINTPVQFVGDNLNFLTDALESIKSVLEKFRTAAEAAPPQKATALAEALDYAAKVDLEFLFSESPTALKESLHGIAQISRIVRAMREFAHPVSHEKEPMEINKIIETTLTVSRNEWKNAAEIALNLDPNLPTTLGFPGEISQVLLNLIINASHAIRDKHKGQRGRIEIGTGVRNGKVCLTIADNGGGIADEIREKVFEPFFTTKEVGVGTGQGLAISRDIVVRRHGGSIRFNSTLGGGTTFEIELPIAGTS
jgi:two-component system NtrC family sensor kinase